MSDLFLRFFAELELTRGDRVALKRLRRKIRASVLTEGERAELLAQARYVPGCIPPLLTLNDDGTTRPMTDEEIQGAMTDSPPLLPSRG